MKKARRLTIIIALIFFSCHFAAAQYVSQTELIKVSFQKSDLKAECIIECTKPVAYESFSLMNPNRLVVDLTKIEKVLSSPQIQVNDSGILKITTSMQSADTARIVVYFLGDVLKYEISETDEGINLIFGLIEKAVAPVKKIPAVKQEKKIQKLKETTNSIKPSNKKNNFGIYYGVCYIQDQLFQNIYGKSSPYFGAEYSFKLPIKAIKYLDIWFGFSAWSKSGKTTYFEEDIKLGLSNFSLALRYIGQFGRFAPFIGAGIDYFVYKETYPEGYPVGSIQGSDIGYHLQVGTYIDIVSFLAGKIHIKYNSAKTDIENNIINFGGVRYGIGLVIRFNL